LASFLGAGGYQLLILGTAWNLDLHIGAGIVAALLYLLIGKSFGFYQVADILSSRRKTLQILRQWFLTCLSLALLAFLFKIGIEFSRVAIIGFATLALPLLFASRDLMKTAVTSAVTRNRVRGRRVIVVGLRDEFAALRETDLLNRFGLTEVGRIAFPNHRDQALSWGKKAASLDQALIDARDRGAEEIVLALCWNDPRSIELARDWLRCSPLPVRLLPDQKVRYFTENPAFSVGRSLSIEIHRAPLSKFERASKRALDIAVACVALIFLLPVMLVAALTIKLESGGPVLFRQQRVGFNSKRFSIFKLRTMDVAEDGDTIAQVKRFDPRVTRVGRILRATSIDELPQLFNVLSGEMSLIGPRPHAIAHDSFYGNLLSEYAFRHHVKPGMTGWAQVNGCRGRTPRVEHMQSRLDLDLWYIKNWSVGLDLWILLKTVVEVARRRNAY
jgi:undecaprenyl-phosphate galactose phosphotransferase/putative colanic acid biosynthesis UDP-glucose lipid carrier transferase